MSDDIKYASPLKRSIAFNIDVMITIFIRVISFQILAFFTISEEVNLLREEIQGAIDSGILNENDQQSFFNFVYNSQYFQEIMKYIPTILLIIFIIGGIYYPIMETSKKCSTIGKRIMKIVVIDKNGKKLTFIQSLFRYLINFIPLIMLFYIVSKISVKSFDLFTILICFVTFFWYHISSFNKEKSTLTDMLSNSIAIEGKKD